ncbi:hypothetical protein DFH29DRAFT_1005325 [Suillus ampliporus]|nr:hypothetical protein DFH29DRAFT_1005325 [Suillus ampliporus]
MPHKRHALSISASEGSSASESDSSISRDASESRRSSPTPIAKSKAPKVSDKGKKAEKRPVKKPNSRGDSNERDQCLHVAHWIPHAIDMYVALKDTFRIGMLLEQEEAAKDGTLIEDDATKKERHVILQNVKKEVQERYFRTYNRILISAPYLRTLITGNTKKHRKELDSILSEDTIGQICSEDASKLKPYIGRYAAAEPDVKGLEPPIFSNDKKSRARMCRQPPPTRCHALSDQNPHILHEDRKKVQAQLQNGEGDSPGENFDPLNMQDGLFKGYLMRRVFRHIFKGPSSALVKDGEAVTTTRSGNAKLHNMTQVDAEHIAYTFVQALFHHATNGRQLTAWVDSLLEWWNMSVFGDKAGVPVFDVSDNNNEEEDDLISMRKQFASRAAAARVKSVSTNAQPSKGITPSDLDSDKSMMDTTSTPATMPPPIEEPTPPPARAIPKPHPVKPTPRKQVPPVVMTPIKETPARASAGLSKLLHGSRSNVVESDGEISELTEEESDAPAPSKCARKSKGATTTVTKRTRRSRK